MAISLCCFATWACVPGTSALSVEGRCLQGAKMAHLPRWREGEVELYPMSTPHEQRRELEVFAHAIISNRTRCRCPLFADGLHGEAIRVSVGDVLCLDEVVLME